MLHFLQAQVDFLLIAIFLAEARHSIILTEVARAVVSLLIFKILRELKSIVRWPVQAHNIYTKITLVSKAVMEWLLSRAVVLEVSNIVISPAPQGLGGIGMGIARVVVILL